MIVEFYNLISRATPSLAAKGAQRAKRRGGVRERGRSQKERGWVRERGQSKRQRGRTRERGQRKNEETLYGCNDQECGEEF